MLQTAPPWKTPTPLCEVFQFSWWDVWNVKCFCRWRSGRTSWVSEKSWTNFCRWNYALEWERQLTFYWVFLCSFKSRTEGLFHWGIWTLFLLIISWSQAYFLIQESYFCIRDSWKMELRWENMYYEISYSLNGIFNGMPENSVIFLACLLSFY